MPRPDELDRCIELAGIGFRRDGRKGRRNFEFWTVRVEGGGS